jgi:hypothetical protein
LAFNKTAASKLVEKRHVYRRIARKRQQATETIDVLAQAARLFLASIIIQETRWERVLSRGNVPEGSV